jgi:hypothetical protein
MSRADSSAAPAPVSASRQLLGRWGLLLGWLLLTFFLVVPPREAMTPDLDSSNHATYGWMLANHKQFGTEVVPMTGPYGFLFYGITYSGYLFTARLIGDLLLKAVFAFIVLRLFARAGAGAARWCWLAAIVLFLPNIDDLVYDVAILFSGLLLLLSRSDRPRGADHAALLLLGFLSLLKGNHFVLSAVTIGAVMLRGVLTRQRGWIFQPAITWVVTVLIFWIGAAQHPAHLPAYVKGILELASGYNDAMAYDESLLWFVTGVAVAAGGAPAVIAALWPGRDWGRLPLLCFFLGFGFMKWKHGYVRADGHIFIFFFFMAVLLPTLWLARSFTAGVALPRLRRLAAAALGGATFLLAVAAACDFWDLRFLALFRDLPGSVQRNAAYLSSPSAWRERLEHDLAQNRIAFDLPQIRNEIAGASVDFFGFEQGILLLNGLNYHPRPMGGGSFNVYTRYLQRLNEAFVRDPQRRPAYQVVKLRTLDNRLPAADDPVTLYTLLHHYSPVLIQREFLLLRDRGPDVNAPHPKLLQEVAARLGEPLEVPDPGPGQMLLFKIKAPFSLRGALRSFLYRPSDLQVRLDLAASHRTHTFRLIPRMAAVPVILSPLLEDNLDVVRLYGPEPGRQVRRLTLLPQDAAMFAGEDVRVTFYTLPRPPPPVDTDVEEIVTYMKFPLHNRAPLSVTTENTGIRELNKEPITLVHAPGEITFPLEMGDQQVIFSYGLMPQAYDPGQTDGVEFVVEVLPPEGPARMIFRNLLRPVSTPEHRGMQRARVYLPAGLPSGSRLRLRTETGPDRNGAWDQSYITRLQIKKGLPDPRQFFGFNVDPEAPGFAAGSELVLDGRPLRGVHPPTELAFRVPADARRLVATFGLMPGAYQGENRTDGVEFTFLLRRPDGTTETLARRFLDPLNRTEDRGLQNVALLLPPLPAGSLLIFQTGPGPHDNLSWDWAVLQTLYFN